MTIDNVINGKRRAPVSRRRVGAWEIPTCEAADVSLALKAARIAPVRPLHDIIAGLEAIGRAGSWLNEADLRLIVEATQTPLYFLRRSIARTNTWLANIGDYVASLGRPVLDTLFSGTTIHRGGLSTAIILAGDSSAVPAQTLTHALLANARALVKPSSAEPLSTMRFTEALLSAGLPCPQLLFLDSSSDEGRDAIRRVISTSAQSVVYGEDRTIAEIYRPLSFLPAHKALPFWSGRSGAILLPDADVAEAAREVLAGVVYDRGNKCISTKRVLVPAAMLAAFVAELRAQADALPRGSSVDEQAVIAGLGTGAREAALELCAGAEVLYDRDVVIARPHGDDSPLLCEEHAYPLLGVRAYAPDEDPVALTNAAVAHGPMGRALVVSVFTSDARAFEDAAARLSAYKVLRDVATTTVDLCQPHQGGHLFLDLMRTGDQRG